MSRAPGLAYVWAFLRLGRLHFLAGGFLLHGLGVAIALYLGAHLNLAALLWGQIAITATQLMTHYANDYFDLEADRANHTPTHWSGGSRVLPDGELPARIAFATALTLAGLALLAALVLAFVVRTGPLTLPLLLLALAGAWSYSGPPLHLERHGLGEVTAALLVPGLTPLVGFYLQSGQLSLLPLLASAPLCLLQFAMLVVINFPDAAGDAAASKHTLVVRYGAAHGARLHNLALLAAYALLPLLVVVGLPPLVALCAALTSPLALWQWLRMRRGDWRRPERWDVLAFAGVALLVGTIAAEALGFLGLAGK